MSPFVWFDLAARSDDADTATEFYRALFDWPAQADRHGPYRAWFQGDSMPWAAVVASEDLPPGWLPYVRVGDLDTATATAVDHGAEVLVPANDGPAGTAAVIRDPAGAHLALWTPFADR